MLEEVREVREVTEELVVEEDGFELNREPVALRMGVMCSLECTIVGGGSRVLDAM